MANSKNTKKTIIKDTIKDTRKNTRKNNIRTNIRTTIKTTKTNQAQSTAGGALFILMLLIFMVLYLLFIPPAVREEILNISDEEDGNASIDVPESEYVYVEEQPGNLYYSAENSFKHNMPSTYLIERSENELLWSWNSVHVSSGLFKKDEASLEFSIDNVEEIQSGTMAFDVKEANGIIEILLNGQLIYNGMLDEGTVNPIEIRGDSFDAQNVLVIRSEPSGSSRTSEFIIENIRIFGERKKSMLEGTMNFFVYPEEISSPRKSVLRFYAECNQQTTGKLSIRINNQLIFDSVPACGNINLIEFSPYVLNNGNNMIGMVSESNIYIREPSVEVQIAEPIYPTYYFNIDDDEYEQILNGSKKVMMYLSFVSTDNKLEAEINGGLLYIETDDYIIRDITDFVKRTGNYVSLIPKKETKINLIKIYLE